MICRASLFTTALGPSWHHVIEHEASILKRESRSHSGHYTAYIHHEESDKWYHMNDSVTDEIAPDQLEKELSQVKAYILFYKQREEEASDPPLTSTDANG